MAKNKKKGGEAVPDPMVPEPTSSGFFDDDPKEETTPVAKEQTEVIKHIIM